MGCVPNNPQAMNRRSQYDHTRGTASGLGRLREVPAVRRTGKPSALALPRGPVPSNPMPSHPLSFLSRILVAQDPSSCAEKGSQRGNARGFLVDAAEPSYFYDPRYSAALAREFNFVTTETATESILPLWHVLVAYYVACLCVNLETKRLTIFQQSCFPHR